MKFQVNNNNNNRRISGDHQAHSIIKIGRNTQKCPGDLLSLKLQQKKKRILKANEKTTRNQKTEPKSYPRDKHLSCPHRMILGTVFKVDERRTSTNRPENKKTHDDE